MFKKLLTDCFLHNSVVNYREIPVGAYLRDTQYKNPDKYKWITRHISTKNGCYYTPNNTRGGFSWRGSMYGIFFFFFFFILR